MSFQTLITQQVAALTERLNAIAINAKKIIELPWQSILNPSSEIHVSDAGTSYKIKIQQIFDWFYSIRQNQLLSVNISVLANDIAIASGAQWIIANVNYSNPSIIVINIPYAQDGYTRNDILVANKLNQIIKISGPETVGISPTPPTPIDTVLVTIINVTDATISYTPPIIGGDYEKVINKAVDFTVVNNTLYPSVQASKTYIDAGLAFKANLSGAIFTGAVSGISPTLDDHFTTKSYADALVANVLNLRGGHDASGNLFPTTGGSGTAGAVKKGDIWFVSVPGILKGKNVEVGDSFMALANAPGQTAASWNVLETNIGYVPANDANVIHTTGNEVKSGVLTFADYPIINPATASTIAGFSSTKQLVPLSPTIYPSLTELAFVKGVTSSIQTQLDSKISGSGIINRISKWSASGVQTNSLLLEGNNDIVYQLATYGASSTTDESKYIFNTSGTNGAGIGARKATTNTADLILYTQFGFNNSTQSAIFKANGNVGLGTSTPLNILGVNLPTGTGKGISLQNGASEYARFGVINPTVSNDSFIGSISNNNFLIYTNNTEKIRVEAGGNVGIGTSAPNYNLHINSGATNNYLQFTNTATGTSALNGLVIGVDTAKAVQFFNRENTAMQFFTNNTEKLRIHASGGVSIGNTTDLGAGTLAVSGNISTIAGTSANHVVIKSQLDLKADLSSPALTGTPTAPTATVGASTTQVATTAFVQSAVVSAGIPYKIYAGLANQSGVTAPVVSVLQNTIGAIVWTYTTAGRYTGTLTGAFTGGKTLCFISDGSNNLVWLTFRQTTNNTVELITRSGSAYQDGNLINSSIEIRVYP